MCVCVWGSSLLPGFPPPSSHLHTRTEWHTDITRPDDVLLPVQSRRMYYYGAYCDHPSLRTDHYGAQGTENQKLSFAFQLQIPHRHVPLRNLLRPSQAEFPHFSTGPTDQRTPMTPTQSSVLEIRHMKKYRLRS